MVTSTLLQLESTRKTSKCRQFERFCTLIEASQASDVGSIPIARSRNPDDSTTLTRLGAWKSPKRLRVLDGRWTEAISIGRSSRIAASSIRGPESHDACIYFQPPIGGVIGYWRRTEGLMPQ